MIRRFLFLILLSGATSSLPAQDATSALGLVIQIKGTAYVQRGATKTAARLADPLFAGDRVLANGGEVVVLYCPTAEKLSVRSGAVIEIGAAQTKILKGPAPLRSAGKCALPRTAFGTEDLNLVGGLRARGYPPVTLYLGGPVSKSRPLFQWAVVESADTYHLSIRNSQSDVIWQTRASAPGVQFPENIPALAEGKYEWEVRAQSKEKTVAQGTAEFEVKPNPALTASSEMGGESPLLQAIELENAGYYAEAAGIYRGLREAATRDARLTRRLAWLYWSAGLFTAASEEVKKLRGR